MGQFDGILICTDLDGTLLRKDKSISPDNIKAIEFFKKNGGLFTFVTGRVPKTVEDICRIVKPNAPFGYINGGGVYDYAGKKVKWIKTLDKKVTELIEYIDVMLPSVGILVNTNDNIYFSKDNSVMKKYREERNLDNITCDYHLVKEPIIKIVFAENDESVMLKLGELLKKHHLAAAFSFVRSETNLYEIVSKGISKATALSKIVELCNVDMKKTIAIGDYDNDIDMVRCAEIGVAVSNASDNLKNAARYVTVSNEEDAIAIVIEEIYSGKIKV